MRKYLFILLLIAAAGFATYKLTESPPTWYDEGLIIQSAINLARSGSMAFQFAPDAMSSSFFISTGYTVIYPIGLVFKLWGISLGAARSVMALYIVLLVLVFYYLARRLTGVFYALFSTALLVTYAPLYGNGKNVLGEVPGLFFLLLCLLCLTKLQKEANQSRKFYWYYILAGAAAGLGVVTKPIFLLFLPAFALAFIFQHRQLQWSWPRLFIFTAAGLVPFLFWLVTQFGGVRSLISILGFYINPSGISSLGGTAGANIKRFVLEISPFYFAIMMLVWLSSIFVRVRQRLALSFIEVVSIFFALLIWLAYLRTTGWYRYFFPAQIVAFLYFPLALAGLAEYFFRRFAKHLTVGILSLAIVVQTYQVIFHSWVADSYQSDRTNILSNFFNKWTDGQSVLIYNSPELVIFLPTANYYQYLALTDFFILGQEQFKLAADKKIDRIIVKQADWEKSPSLFAGYHAIGAIDRYKILTK